MSQKDNYLACLFYFGIGASAGNMGESKTVSSASPIERDECCRTPVLCFNAPVYLITENLKVYIDCEWDSVFVTAEMRGVGVFSSESFIRHLRRTAGITASSMSAQP